MILRRYFFQILSQISSRITENSLLRFRSYIHTCPQNSRTQNLTSVVHVVDNMEFVLHRGAVGTAEAAGEEEEEECDGCGQPAAHRDPETAVSRSARQHDVGSSKALQRTGTVVNKDLLE